VESQSYSQVFVALPENFPAVGIAQIHPITNEIVIKDAYSFI